MNTYSTSETQTAKKTVTVKRIVIGVVVMFLLGAAVILVTQPSATGNHGGITGTGSLAQRVVPPPVKATTDINREFAFSLGTKSKDTIKYTIQSAEKMDEIIVNGQKAYAVAGRTFLILNVKITNDTQQGIKINTRDFVRMSSPEKDNEWLAPDIHNDPVEVQALSTKYTRLGFPVSNTINSFKLRIGEINGTKTNVDLLFQ